MIPEYRCPTCARLFFYASGLRFDQMHIKCRTKRCGIVTPSRGGPLVGYYRCPKCDRTETNVAAPDASSYCALCGVSMVRTKEPVRERSEEQPVGALG